MSDAYILASHGRLAEGLKNSLEMILGKQESIYTMSCYLEDDFDIDESILNMFQQTKKYEKVIVITDILGGSVHNEFVKRYHQFNFFLISGMSFPLLVELLLSREQKNNEVIQNAISNSKQTIQLFDETQALSNDEIDF